MPTPVAAAISLKLRPSISCATCTRSTLPNSFPLVKLYQRLPRNKYDAAFFLPRLSPAQFETQQSRGMNPEVAFYYSRQFLEHFDLPLLDLEQRFSVVDELAAYRKFAPDLIV